LAHKNSSAATATHGAEIDETTGQLVVTKSPMVSVSTVLARHSFLPVCKNRQRFFSPPPVDRLRPWLGIQDVHGFLWTSILRQARRRPI